ncbi:MAG: iron-sulfur cluster assembly accessory protein [Pseudomonadota bacterium]
MRELPKAITITDRAADRVKELMSEADSTIIGVRVGVNARGCSGMSYTMEYATDRKPMEEMVEDKGVMILIEPQATFFLLGSEMDYVSDRMSAQFVFNNPNEIDRCGCGESFRVAPEVAEAAKQAGK